MSKVIKVESKEIKKIFVIDFNGIDITLNDNVIVEVGKDLFYCSVYSEYFEIEENKIEGKLIRKANEKDNKNYKLDIDDAKKVLLDAKIIAEKYDLKMKFIDAFFTFNRNQLLINFYSEDRIDFRLLAKDLAFIYKVRIELRQVGVRDKAKKTGGIGCCGQELCCSRFLNDFETVSISMAKNQNISLNPNKINGVCGRLLCCLKYENDNYKDCKKCTPQIGQIVKTSHGEGRVVFVDLLNKKYKVDIPNVGIIEESSCNGSN